MNTTRPALSLGGILPDVVVIKDAGIGDLCCDRRALVQEWWCSLSLVVYLTSTLEHHQLACALTTHWSPIHLRYKYKCTVKDSWVLLKACSR